MVLAALAAAALVLAAVPGALAARGPLPAAAFDIAPPSPPLRDAVLPAPSATASRALRGGQAGRYPVNDGQGRTVAISVTPACEVTCNAANPQAVANFLGNLIHGDEMSLLRVELVAPTPEMATICGQGALACYFSGANRMVISGDDDAAPDGATRAFIIAHEYGHHVAQHRLNPPFEPAINYGTKRWSSFERVCQGARRGQYFPGDQGNHYFQNPGEAFAESFAFTKFPNAPVQWAWIDSLRPRRGSFRAIRADTLRPWAHRTRAIVRGELSGREVLTARRVRTPLDGVLSVRLEGPRRSDFDLLLRDGAGRVVRRSQGVGSEERVSFLICGQARFRAVVRRADGPGGDFKLVFRRP